MARYRITVSTDRPSTTAAIALQEALSKPSTKAILGKYGLHNEFDGQVCEDYQFEGEGLTPQRVRSFVASLPGNTSLQSWDYIGP